MRKFWAILGIAITLLAGGIGVAAPASATHGAGICDGHWLYASWGRGCTQPPYGQTQDYGPADGYCVEARWYNRTYNRWDYIPNSTSCGYVASWQTNDHSCIRMYNGNGRYLTLRRNATWCP